MRPRPAISSTSSTFSQSPDSQYRVIRKRNRVPLSCAPCRHRKLKCNRGHPCDNCVKRGDAATCAYAAPTGRRKSHPGHALASTPDEMQKRIDRLEGLILSLMTNGHHTAGPSSATAALALDPAHADQLASPLDDRCLPVDEDEQDIDDGIDGNDGNDSGHAHAPHHSHASSSHGQHVDADDSDIDRVATSIGVLKVDSNKTLFASDAHWYAILAEVSEVKSYFAEHKCHIDEQYNRLVTSGDDKPGGALLIKGGPTPSRPDIVAAFPPKATVDQLVAQYFTCYDPGVHIIHGPTFQEQYDRHWADPNESPIIFYGMVFAMMCLAMQSFHRTDCEPPDHRGRAGDLSGHYRRLTAQCLLLEDFTRPVNYVLETLVLHVQAEIARSRDTEPGVFVLVTIIARLAMKMGYHRDGKPYPLVTPFMAEMRRRMWIFIRSADLLFSYQSGLPPIIRACDTDTELPKNLYDDEIQSEMKVLPPSRPAHEATPVSYMIAKGQLVLCLGKIMEQTHSLAPAQYDAIMQLDRELHDAHASLPSYFRARPFAESIQDPAQLVVERISLDLIFLKAQCILHRKFLGYGRRSSQYTYSRRSCVDAAVDMLQHQLTLHTEAQPAGRLRKVEWHAYSLTSSDFLLAAMIVSLDLHHVAEAERGGRAVIGDLHVWSLERQDAMLTALTRAVAIWEGQRDCSIEAYKAHAALCVMLEKLRTSQRHSTNPTAEAQRMAAVATAVATTTAAAVAKTLLPTLSPNSTASSTAPSMAQLTGQSVQLQASPPSLASALTETGNVALEHSAAMTLGMLSAGAGPLPPPSSALLDSKTIHSATAPQLSQNRALSQNEFESGTYLHQRPTVASLPSVIAGSGAAGQSLLGAAPSFTDAEMQGMGSTEIDWNAWDYFIHSGAADPNGGSFWPMAVDSLLLPDAESVDLASGIRQLTG